MNQPPQLLQQQQNDCRKEERAIDRLEYSINDCKREKREINKE